MRRGRPRLHKEGIRTVTVRCMQFETIGKIVDYYNKQNLTTPEGFEVRVGITDVVSLAIDNLAKSCKIKIC